MVRRANPWSLWLTGVIGSFAAMELRALTRGDIPTLSECLARWSGVHPRRRHGGVTPLVFVAGATWLAIHIATWGSGSALDKSEWIPLRATSE